MKPQLETRSYTNFILSVIAALLLLITLHLYQVQVGSSALAQTSSESPSSGESPSSSIANTGIKFARPGRNAPIDESNVAQTQDTAVASATNNVAEANHDIAAAIRELATGLKTANPATTVGGAANATLGATATDTAQPQPPSDAAAPTVEISTPAAGNR